MKKLFTILLCALIVGALALSVSAAGSSVSITPSETTLHRGDTFTIVANLTNSDPINLGTVVLSYDESVFELTGGTCHVAGANPAQVVVAQKAGTFFLGSASAVSGKIFTFNFKVKDNAAFGTYTFSTTAAIGTSGGNRIDATGTTIVVACNHNYSNWADAGNGKHSKTCSICQDVQTVNHTWDNGAVTKAATCKETGVKTYTCTACKATETETIAKLSTHTYGDWSKVNDTTHKHTCSVCQKEETVSHNWIGKVTKAATCKEEGVKTFTCTACKATKTETIAKLTTHTYDHACDTDCNVCGVTRTTTHNYKTSWSKDKTNHWHECSVCKDKKDQAAHTPGAEATETTAQTCTTCGYVIKSALGHKHSYATTWTTDANGHWYACSGCEEKGSYAEHDFENACDKDCSICGYTRETSHNYPEDWNSDKNNHWHGCTGCGLKQDEAAHEPGAEATETTAQTCTICGYEIAPALGEKDTESATTPVAPTEPVGNGEPSADSTVWIIVAVTVVLLGGGTAGIIIWKKKH